MKKKLLIIIRFLATGMIESNDVPTLRNVERTINLTFDDWHRKPSWKPVIDEADGNSPNLSKAVVLAYAWAEEKGECKALIEALKYLKESVLLEDKGYQQRLADSKKAHDQACEELWENRPPGLKKDLI